MTHCGAVLSVFQIAFRPLRPITVAFSTAIPITRTRRPFVRSASQWLPHAPPCRLACPSRADSATPQRGRGRWSGENPAFFLRWRGRASYLRSRPAFEPAHTGGPCTKRGKSYALFDLLVLPPVVVSRQVGVLPPAQWATGGAAGCRPRIQRPAKLAPPPGGPGSGRSWLTRTYSMR